MQDRRPSSAGTVTAPTSAVAPRWLLLTGAVGFVVAFFAATSAINGLASSSLPLPDDPASAVRDWYADNPTAAVVAGLLQLVSVTLLAGFVRLVGRGWAWGYAAVAAMVACVATTWGLAAVAADASLDTVGLLRDLNFALGGTLHVAALGGFVWLAARHPAAGRRLRTLAWVALVPSVASLASLVVLEAAPLILLGRLLCMVWLVSAAVGLSRSR